MAVRAEPRELTAYNKPKALTFARRVFLTRKGKATAKGADNVMLPSAARAIVIHSHEFPSTVWRPWRRSSNGLDGRGEDACSLADPTSGIRHAAETKND